MDVHSKVLELDDGRTVMFDKLLLATGGRPKSLPVFDNAEEAVRERVIRYRTVRPAPSPRTTLRRSSFVPVLSALHCTSLHFSPPTPPVQQTRPTD